MPKNGDSVVHRLRCRRLDCENVRLFELHPVSDARKVLILVDEKPRRFCSFAAVTDRCNF